MTFRDEKYIASWFLGKKSDRNLTLQVHSVSCRLCDVTDLISPGYKAMLGESRFCGK